MASFIWNLSFLFLLYDAFDFIFVQPALRHIWEDTLPVGEVTKAYIKRAMPYLKSEGCMVIILEDHLEDTLMQELSQSKRYEMEVKKGVILPLQKEKDAAIA